MIGHLGPRVSALLDGQLSGEEEERAWAHVHSCHSCRDLVEREGWIKTRLSGLSGDPAGSAPSALKGSILGVPPYAGPGPAASLGAFGADHAAGVAPRGWSHPPARSRRAPAVVALGGGALGAAVLGVLALGVAPATAPTGDRRPPAASIDWPVDTASPSTSSPRSADPAPATVASIASAGLGPVVGPALGWSVATAVDPDRR